MTGTIQIPSKGEGLKAAWGASVANGLNALMPMAPARMLVRESAGGVGCEPLPQNLRDRKAAAVVLPWTFSCTVGEDENGDETRTGGWTNCRMQIGYDASFGDEIGTHRDLCKDGLYYAEVDLINMRWDLKVIEKDGDDMPGKDDIPPHDFENSKVNVYIGTVDDAVCTYSIHCIPVVYKYV